MVAGMDVNTIEGSIETTPGTAPGELGALRAQIASEKAELCAPDHRLGDRTGAE